MNTKHSGIWSIAKNDALNETQQQSQPQPPQRSSSPAPQPIKGGENEFVRVSRITSIEVKNTKRNAQFFAPIHKTLLAATSNNKNNNKKGSSQTTTKTTSSSFRNNNHHNNHNNTRVDQPAIVVIKKNPVVIEEDKTAAGTKAAAAAAVVVGETKTKTKIQTKPKKTKTREVVVPTLQRRSGRSPRKTSNTSAAAALEEEGEDDDDDNNNNNKEEPSVARKATTINLPMDIIETSPYEGTSNAEHGVPLFEELRHLLLSGSSRKGGDNNTGSNNNNNNQSINDVFGEANAKCLVKTYRHIEKSGIAYSQEWVDGVFRGNVVGVLPKDLLLLCLISKRLGNIDEFLMAGLTRDLEVSKIVKEALQTWELQDQYPKVRKLWLYCYPSYRGFESFLKNVFWSLSLSLLVVVVIFCLKKPKLAGAPDNLKNFTFVGKRRHCFRCELFVARTYSCYKAFKMQGEPQAQNGFFLEKSLQGKVLKCLDIMESHVPNPAERADFNNKKRKRNNNSSSNGSAGFAGKEDSTIGLEPIEVLSSLRDAMESSSPLTPSPSPPPKRKRGRPPKNKSSLASSSQTPPYATTATATTTATLSGRKRGGGGNKKQSSLAALIEQFEEQYKDMGKRYHEMGVTLSILKEKLNEDRLEREQEIRNEIFAEVEKKIMRH